MGNIRLSYSDLDKSGDIDKETEIIEENNYYPFGLKHRGYNEIVNAETEHKFRFNDTEFDDDFDLNWYNMPLRHQDPTTGRWNGIDPVTHFSSSTYSGYENNPVYWADPSGADWTSFWAGIKSFFGGGSSSGMPKGYGKVGGSGGSGVDGFLGKLAFNWAKNKALGKLNDALQTGGILIHYKGDRYLYNNGVLRNGKSGNIYTGKNGELTGFIKKAKEALDEIRSGGNAGAELIENLQNNQQYYTQIKRVNTGNQTKGLNVEWNTSLQSGGLDTRGKRKRPIFISLAHELAHVWDLLEDGKIDEVIWYVQDGKDILNAEKYASHWENRVRAENNLNLRKYYSPNKNKNALLLNNRGESLHQSQSNVIRYNPTEVDKGNSKLYYPNFFIEIKVTTPFEY